MSVIRPKEILRHYSQVTPKFLSERNIIGLLLDLDNTVVPYKNRDTDSQQTHQLVKWLDTLQIAQIPVHILSNATLNRAEFWCQHLKIQGKGLAGKPNPLAFKRAAARMGLQPQQIAMLGDQLFTDVLGANLIGMQTFLVNPLSDNALPHTAITRRLERLVLQHYGISWLID